MRKIWLVASATYRERVRAGTFLVLTFGLPLLMVIAGAVPIFFAESDAPLPALGMVDESGHLTVPNQVTVDEDTVPIATYPDPVAAQLALDANQIGAYLVVPVDYFAGTPPTLYTAPDANARLERAFRRILRTAMTPDAPAWLLARLSNPATFSYVDSTTGTVVEGGVGRFSRILTPILLALFFGLLVFTSTSQLGSAIVREKDQRAMEIVITSLAPRQLVMGKVLGMALLSLTQVAVWLMGGLFALLLAFTGSFDLRQLSIPWPVVGWAVLLGIPTYFLYAVLAAGLGIIAGDSQQAQQLAGFLGFFGLAPFWLVGVIVGEPDGTLPLALTLFPLSSPMIALLRMAFTIVPRWQLMAALLLIVACLFLSIWFVTRIFRSAMLLYGQTLRPRAIWQALRTG
ncbi:MAG TPA: ABC transporter permease [Caldilineaceae bacterium]|nr:ABC transporter permease [Caldilineaceae bacterium]